MTHKIKPDDTSPDNATTTSATESPYSAKTKTPPQSNNTINKETITTAPSTTDEEATDEQINRQIQAILAETGRLGKMINPELCEEDEEFSIDYGLASVAAYQMRYDPSHLFHWLGFALIDCGIDVPEHPVNGLLQVCQGYFAHEEIMAEIEEQEEKSA